MIEAKLGGVLSALMILFSSIGNLGTLAVGYTILFIGFMILDLTFGEGYD